jgi:hypothetical protein
VDEIADYHAYIDEMQRDVMREAAYLPSMLAYFYGLWHPADGEWFEALFCDPMENVL